MHLQQTYGNRYVQRLIESTKVQAKLTVSSPGDVYEQEADRVADMVTRKISADEVQRQVPEEEEEVATKRASDIQRQVPEEEEEIAAKPASEIQHQPFAVSRELEANINAARGSGQPLPDSVRDSLEPQLGHDFSQVHIHADAKADELSQKLNAEAFTTGNDVFFKEGAYQPGSDSGRGLIAHELAHVVQQSAAPPIQRQATETQTEGEQKPKESDVTYYIKVVQDDIQKFYTEGAKITEEGSNEAKAEYKWEGNTINDEMGYKVSADGSREEYQNIVWTRPDGSQYGELHIVSYNKGKDLTTVNHDVSDKYGAKETTTYEHEGPPTLNDWKFKPSEVKK
jgi:hypothetical protein